MPLNFGGTPVKEVNEHKHLGLTFNKSLSWSNHITSILGSVANMADVLKKLKHEVDRKSLETIYFTFIRPKIEYACFIWDNCTQQEETMLEQFQLDMARVVTGARRGTSHALIYAETNWLTLKERRELIKLKQFCKIKGGEAPNYMINLLPDRVANAHHNLRNSENIKLIKTRTETFRKSFLPSAIKLWNDIPLEERSLEAIQSKLKFQSIDLYNYGSRKVNIIHSQMRMLCSKLKSHLFLLHVADSPRCHCGFNEEDNNHFLLECPLYEDLRRVMIRDILNVTAEIHCDTLMFGNDTLSYEDNVFIFSALHTYIEATGRF